MISFHRVAFLEPRLTWNGASTDERRVAAMHLWHQQLDVCVRVPTLSIAMPNELGGGVPWGLPSDPDSNRERVKEAFATWRRDELLWLEATVKETSVGLTLHAIARDDQRRSFDAVGSDVGTALTTVLNAWLQASGLGALVAPCESMSVATMLNAVRQIASFIPAESRVLHAAETPMLELVKAAAEDEKSDDSDSDEEDSGEEDDADDEDSSDDDDDSSDDDDSDDDDDADEDLEDDDDGVDGDADGDAGPEGDSPEQLKKCLEALGSPGWSLVRTAHSFLGGSISAELQRLDPDHPWSLWLAFAPTRSEDPDFDALRRCLAAAPGWWMPYDALTDDEDELPEPETDEAFEKRPTGLERTAAATFMVYANPASHQVGTNAARLLADEHRGGEALRILRDRVARFGRDSAEHIELLRLHEDTERIGDWVHEARESAWRHGCPMAPGAAWFPDQILVDLGESDALMQAGRLEEAIQLRGNRLDGLAGSWPRHTSILEKWKRSPRFVAWSYSREGAFRGEDARVVEGFGRVEPGDGVDLGLFLDALVATGREREVPMAWAHFGEGHEFGTAFARLRAARALFAAGAWKTGLEQLLEVSISAPQRGDEGERAHVARMLTGVPDEIVTSVLGELLDARAGSIAWHLGRELADFWPGAAKSRVVTWALGKQEASPPPPSVITIPGLDAASAKAIDELLAQQAPTLEAADALVNEWPERVFGGEPKDVTLRLAHTATRALDRYLRATLSAPMPVAGAFRTIAAEALEGLARRGEHLDVSIARAVLEALEPLWELVHPRVADRWLSAIDRSLLLEELTQGALGKLLAGLPNTDERLLTPERVALRSLELAQLYREKKDGWAAKVAPLAERLAWHTWDAGPIEWANAVVALREEEELHADDALDALSAAAFLTRDHDAEASVLAALAQFEAGDGEAAFAILCAGLQPAGEEWRDKALARLKKPFEAAKLGVPFDFQKAANGVLQAFQKNDPVKAERLARWCLALDSENGEIARNLGLALAYQGRVTEALGFLVRATPEQATQILSGVLSQQQKVPEALAVLDFASRWFVRADQWLTYGGVVYGAMDNPRTVKAYATAWKLDPSVFDASQLNAYAGVLDEVGDAITCEKIARKLIEVAGKDVMWLTNGWNHLACALIGQGQFEEAAKWAKKAVDKNPLPDNTENFAKTLERAKKKQKLEVPPLGPAEPPRHEAYQLAENGDFTAAMAHLQSDDWNARRAALRASRFRFTSDNKVPVTKTARTAASTVLSQSTAQSAIAATICRSFALDLRAEGLDCAFDRPPDLGDRLTRAAFYEEFRARGGVIIGDAPDTKPPFVDAELFPGKPIARTSQYLALLADVGGRPFAEALATHQLDTAAYLEVCTRWGKAIDQDAALAKNVTNAL